MDTATISYRVADFLRKYPPFQAMDDGDLLSRAGRGRVRFHERNEHILSQGESHRHHVFLIQQGVVSLWSDVNGMFELRDVRGAGDLLGVERFNGAPASLYSRTRGNRRRHLCPARGRIRDAARQIPLRQAVRLRLQHGHARLPRRRPAPAPVLAISRFPSCARSAARPARRASGTQPPCACVRAGVSGHRPFRWLADAIHDAR